MNYAIIENGKVANVAVSDTALDVNWIELQSGFGIGDTYVNGVFEKAPIVVSIPTEIRMAQCRAQLIIDSKDDDVELLLNSIADPIQQKLYRAYFEYEPIVKRDNVMINEMAPALAIDLDTFFINASKL